MVNSNSFQEVTNESGINYTGESYGAAWGDFNGDTYPDLYVTNHAEPETLYLNQGDGTFSDISEQVFDPELRAQRRDPHGVAWADFDNDGDLDLIQLAGGGGGTGTGANQMYVNEGGIFVDRASELGIDYPVSRGRTPLWFDFDKDGLLDLFQGAISRPDGEAPPTIFRQTANGFEDVGATVDFDLSNSAFGILSDLSGDGNLDFFVRGASRTIYDTTEIPFEDITEELTPNDAIPWIPDVVSGDFNGDLQSDLYLTRNQSLGSSDLTQQDSDTAQASILSLGNQKGVRFNSAGNLTLDIDSHISFDADDIYIGAGGFNPSDIDFTLSADNSDVEGILSYTPGVDKGIYIGYDSVQQEWQILVSSPEDKRIFFNTLINTSEAISNLSAVGFNADALPLSDLLLINTDEGLVDRSEEALPNMAIAGTSVVSGDFDNDMDLDLYIVATGSAGNRENVLYDNQGDGTFTAVSNGGGASGTSLGVGDSVVTADYDLDGFLDLFVTNGSDPTNFTQNAPYQLFQNQGNDNNWLEIDLEGIVSNRDGIGAQVFVTAGGVTQLREQSGGIHQIAQNHQRIHFGLADNTKVDEILIKWTNGEEQVINNVAANQLLHVIEPIESFAPGKPQGVGSAAGVFIWKETFDGPYQLRTVGEGEQTQFDVNLIATEKLQNVTPFSLEGGDKLQETEYGFDLDSRLFSGQDGVEFELAPGSEALISVTQDGVANPRQLHVGKQGNPLTPDGWIVESEALESRPDFTSGEDLGLFVGEGTSSQELEFRYSSDGNHRTNLSVLSSEESTNFTPVNLESSDTLTNFGNGITIEGDVSEDLDGVDVTVAEPVNIGFAPQQDSLLQPDRVNPLQDDLLKEPNAYWLPVASPEGKPSYSNSSESAIFLWQEEDMWHLRVTAGTQSRRSYTGSIVADSPATSVAEFNLESNDRVDRSEPSRIDFDLNVAQGFQDGIDFSFTEGASVTLNLETPGEDAADLMQVGADRWSVSELPLDLSDW